VLDFGCGEASLLIELAANFPSSAFFGFDPSSAAKTASNNAKLFRLDNLSTVGLKACGECGHYDLIITSHVVEHLLNLELFQLLRAWLAEGGFLYVEVPDALHCESCQHIEFLYYFYRLHVTPQSLVRLAAHYGFGCLKHFEYAFPYRDGGEYPALGMLFGKGGDSVDIQSPTILEAAKRYTRHEKERARPARELGSIVSLDRHPDEVAVGSRKYQTTDPGMVIRNYPWPVVVTVSESRKEISRQITDIDPGRAHLSLFNRTRLKKSARRRAVLS
jgi:trans-aconitate methyltransferase